MPSAPLAVMPFDPLIVSPASTGAELNRTISASATNRLDVLKRLRIIKHKPTPRSGQDSGLLKANQARRKYQTKTETMAGFYVTGRGQFVAFALHFYSWFFQFH